MAVARYRRRVHPLMCGSAVPATSAICVVCPFSGSGRAPILFAASVTVAVSFPFPLPPPFRARNCSASSMTLESGSALVGTEDEISEQLQRRREEWGLSYVVIGDENVDEFAPIVARLAGK